MSLQHEVEVLADSMQIPLMVQDGKLVQKEKERKVGLSDVIRLTLPLKPIQLFHGEQAGVVVRICGDLNIISCYYAKTKKLSLYMVDASKVSGKLDQVVKPTDTLRDVVDKLGKAIVASYHYSNGAWHELTLPKD